MIAFVSIIHVLTCVFIVLFILLQDPKGGVLGTLGGGGGSKAFFGSEGASPFLVNATKWLAIIFACSSFYLSYRSSKQDSIMETGTISQPAQSPSSSSAPASKTSPAEFAKTANPISKTPASKTEPITPEDTAKSNPVNSNPESANKQPEKPSKTGSTNTQSEDTGKASPANSEDTGESRPITPEEANKARPTKGQTEPSKGSKSN